MVSIRSSEKSFRLRQQEKTHRQGNLISKFPRNSFRYSLFIYPERDFCVSSKQLLVSVALNTIETRFPARCNRYEKHRFFRRFAQARNCCIEDIFYISYESTQPYYDANQRLRVIFFWKFRWFNFKLFTKKQNTLNGTHRNNNVDYMLETVDFI